MPDNLEQQPQPTSDGQPETLVFGKYKTLADAEAGYRSSVEEMNKAKNQLGMAVGMIEKLQAQGPPQAQAPVQPEYEKQLEQYGVPVSAVKELIKAIAKSEADSAVSSHLTPIASGANARTAMAQAHPDYGVNEAEVLKYVRSTPELANRFEELLQQNRPYDALEIGYFHWRAQKPVQPASDPTKVAAGMPGGAGSGTRNPQGMQVGKEERIAQAAEHFWATKDFMPLFGEGLGDRALTWSEQMERGFRQQG